MLERFTKQQPPLQERRAYDFDFYQAIAMEYRDLESETAMHSRAILNSSYGDRKKPLYCIGPWERYKLLLKISDQQTQMKQMKESLGFEIGDKDGTRIAGTSETYNPYKHNLMLGPLEPDPTIGETIIVRHSEISAVIHGEKRVLLHAVYDRLAP